MITLADEIKCAQREAAMRRRVYPNWIAQRRMTQANADHEIACMESIAARLERLKHFEDVSRQIAPNTEPVSISSTSNEEPKMDAAPQPEVKQQELI